MPEVYYCEKCNRTMSEKEFYSSNNLEKYPNDGKLPICKKCITMHVDNWDPSTYLWILQEVDVPYIPKEWNKLMATYAKDRSKVSGMTILGRYLSKMKLKQFKDYRWKDTEFLQQLYENEIEQTMKRQGYDQQQIAEAVQKASFSVPEGELKPPEPKDDSYYDNNEQDYFDQENGISDVEFELTDEEKLMLRLKWGKSYKPEEWVKLEQLYNEMMQSYDIQSAGHIDTLKLICKTSLKANQLIDIGDVEGFQKMSKVYDNLMKSGKFTAAQNKAESGEYVDSIGELVAICEKEGFIPRYYTDGPQDKVDKTLLDLQNYTYSLVTEEMNLGTLIEQAVKEIAEDKEKEALASSEDIDEDELLEQELFGEGEAILTDDDFIELRNLQEELADEDEDFLQELTK